MHPEIGSRPQQEQPHAGTSHILFNTSLGNGNSCEPEFMGAALTCSEFKPYHDLIKMKFLILTKKQISC